MALILFVPHLLAAGLTFTAPDTWKKVATSSSMRVAQYALPRAAGDTQDAELVVYYFGGSGGTVEANLARWRTRDDPKGRATRYSWRRSRHWDVGISTA